ncbi:hypothetical protein GQ600_14978 [Phytophthora cactorum]|nr:hypothetical protein GQ600_14978 [Phytophthora cactorum]
MIENPGARKRVNSEASGEINFQGGIVEFRRAWTKLRKAGWTSRPPRPGLDNRYLYIRPGANPKSEEGVDYEAAVLQFIASSVISQVRVGPWVLVLANEAVGKVDVVAARLTEIGSAAKAVE